MQDVDLAVRANKLEILERLADDLAHEIKNPLHSMVINLEVLKRRVARCSTGDSQEMMRYVGVLGNELERLHSRIELLLRLSRPTRGPELTTFGELVDELHELIQLEAGHKGVSIQYEPTGQTAQIRVPRDPVRQVILNLVLDTLDGVSRGDTVVLHHDRHDDRARLALHAIPSERAAAAHETGSSASAAAGPGRHLEIARALGETVGGRIDLVDDQQAGDEVPSRSGTSILFSLPVA
jgi:nitrogen fixation/metabolism regulation signal transduction histidine kinase